MAKILSRIYDKRIRSWNLYLDMTIQEYLDIAEDAIGNNKYQRKRVKTSKSVYALLREDLIEGCVIPPIVLSLTNDDDASEVDPKTVAADVLYKTMIQRKDQVLILDGLQRTYTILDAKNELKEEKSMQDVYLNNKLRVELYININRFGVLYRMLTLNTGQTPMSFRHQVEILYSDFLNSKIDGVTLVTDLDGRAAAGENQFTFKNAVDGFYSYIKRNEQPIDREELLESIRVLDNISTEDIDKDLFKSFLECYAKVFKALCNLTENHEFTLEELEEYQITLNPFGLSASKIFATSQAMTGFGAAIGFMKDRKVIGGFDDIESKIADLRETDPPYDWLLILLKKMDIIRNTSKKIGNAQRLFFKYFFRELFTKDSDSYLKLDEAVENSFNKYENLN